MPTKFTTLLNQLDMVAAVRGNAKSALLAGLPDPELALLPMFQYALDPRVSFGVGKKTITKVEQAAPECGSATLDWHQAMPFLDRLTARALTGSALEAELALMRQAMCPDSWELLKRILVSDLRGGFSAHTVNKIWPDTIPLFELQLANKFGPKKVRQWPADAELKEDGVRMAAECNLDAGIIDLKSRTGNLFDTFDVLKDEAEALLRTVFGRGTYLLDGEIKSGEFADTSGDIHRVDTQIEEVEYHIFELLGAKEFWNSGGHESPPAIYRRARLEQLFARAGGEAMVTADPGLDGVTVRHPGMRLGRLVLVPQYELASAAAAQALFEYLYQQGEEGIIVKERNWPYARKRCNGYLKIKGKISKDCPIIGFEPGERDTKYEHTLGAVVVDYNGVAVSVSSGLSDELRDLIWNDQEGFMGRIMEVHAHEETPDGSLRHPRYYKFRDTLEHGVKE